MADRTPAWTAAEIMTVVASRLLRDGMSCFVGIGIPSTVANLARNTHAPNLFLIYEAGALGAKPYRLPLSIGDGELAETADSVVSVPEIFNYWLQGGHIDVGYLSAAQIDRFGNLNTTVIGPDYLEPKVRLPGAGGAPEIAAHCREVTVIMRHARRAFVPRVDFVTSVGLGPAPETRSRLGFRGAGPINVITDLGILRPDPQDNELTLVAVHPGVDIQDVQDQTQWPLRVASPLDVTEAPTSEELAALRDLQSRS